MKQTSKKDENFFKILSGAIVLDILCGHQEWSITRLAKFCQVSRALVYHYFGKSKLTILTEAVNMIGIEFSGQTKERLELWKKGDMVQSVLRSQEILRKTPALIPFYLLNRNKPTDIGISLRRHEDKFKDKLRLFYPQSSDAEIEALFALFWGVAFSVDLNEESTRLAVQRITKV
jgi:hypothetical protein